MQQTFPTEKYTIPSGLEESADAAKSDHDDDEKENEEVQAEQEKPAAAAVVEEDPIAAAVASIMGPEGEVNIRKSPVKQPLLASALITQAQNYFVCLVHQLMPFIPQLASSSGSISGGEIFFNL